MREGDTTLRFIRSFAYIKVVTVLVMQRRLTRNHFLWKYNPLETFPDFLRSPRNLVLYQIV
jgi:hypothetical protein